MHTDIRQDNKMIQIEVTQKKKMAAGIGLIFLGFLMPVLLPVSSLRIEEHVVRALQNWDSLQLIAAAVELVFLNGIRALPHYLGTYYAAEAAEFRREEKNVWLLNALLFFGIISLTYLAIDRFQGVHYDFGIPAVMVAVILIQIERMDYRYVSAVKKGILCAMVTLGCQFPDIMPAFKNLPIGRGDLSEDIKRAAMLMGNEAALDQFGAAGFAAFLSVAVLLFLMIRDENALREVNILREQNENMRLEAELHEMQKRTWRETQHLVHDLKSPLMVVQTTGGMLRMKAEAEDRTEELPAFTRIEGAVDQMSDMISELLYSDRSTMVSTEKLFSRIASQLSIEDYADRIIYEAVQPEAFLKVNSVLLTRAVVNLVQNAANAAVPGRPLKIIVRAERSLEEEGVIRIIVQDNGRGIDRGMRDQIWSRGVSGRGSSGLGLAFVKEVAERSGGAVRAESRENVGTSMMILIPETVREE